MTGIQYTLRLEQPVLANSLAGDTNSARTLPYIPGGLIRGALISAFLHDNEHKQADAGNEHFRRLFLSGCTRFLNAWPMVLHERALPAPLSLRVQKEDVPAATKNAVRIQNLAIEGTDLHENLKPLQGEVAWLAGDTVSTQEMSLQFNLHTQRDAVYGRARENAGAVFRYEALPAGLKVQGAILASSENDLEILENLLQVDLTFSLGKSRTAGYGQVVVEQVERLYDGWREGWQWPRQQDKENDESSESALPEPEEKSPEFVKRFFVTCLSPVIIRDATTGQHTLDPSTAIAAMASIDEKKLKQKQAFRKSEIVGGFNRTWGLPLPQVWAITQGSVFVYEYEDESGILWKNLLELEKNGLGERQVEGFGRVAVEWITASEPKKDLPLENLHWKKGNFKLEFRRVDNPETALSGDARTMAEFIQKRLLRQELEEKLGDAVRESNIEGNLTKSQISRWRTILRSAMAKAEDKKLDHIREFTGAKEKKPTQSWKSLEQARIKSAGDRSFVSLTVWMDTVLYDKEGKNAPWKQMKYDERIPSIGLGNKETLTPNPALTTEYKLRLIDGVLAKYAKELDKKNRSTKNG